MSLQMNGLMSMMVLLLLWYLRMLNAQSLGLDAIEEYSQKEWNITFRIKLDNYPYEVSWLLKDVLNDEILFSGNGGDYTTSYDIMTSSILYNNDSCFILNVSDSYGDGIFSYEYNSGWFELLLNNNLITLGKQTFVSYYTWLYFCTDIFSSSSSSSGGNSNSSLSGTGTSNLTINKFEYNFELFIQSDDDFGLGPDYPLGILQNTSDVSSVTDMDINDIIDNNIGYYNHYIMPEYYYYDNEEDDNGYNDDSSLITTMMIIEDGCYTFGMKSINNDYDNGYVELLLNNRLIKTVIGDNDDDNNNNFDEISICSNNFTNAPTLMPVSLPPTQAPINKTYEHAIYGIYDAYFDNSNNSCNQNNNNNNNKLNNKIEIIVKLDHYNDESIWYMALVPNLSSLSDISSITTDVEMVAVSDISGIMNYSLNSSISMIMMDSGSNYESEDLIYQSECIIDGCYIFIMNDSYGDGLLSGYDSSGWFEIYLNGELVTLEIQTFYSNSIELYFCTNGWNVDTDDIDDTDQIIDDSNNNNLKNTTNNDNTHTSLTISMAHIDFDLLIWQNNNENKSNNNNKLDNNKDNLIYYNRYEMPLTINDTCKVSLNLKNNKCYGIELNVFGYSEKLNYHYTYVYYYYYLSLYPSNEYSDLYFYWYYYYFSHYLLNNNNSFVSLNFMNNTLLYQQDGVNASKFVTICLDGSSSSSSSISGSISTHGNGTFDNNEHHNHNNNNHKGFELDTLNVIMTVCGGLVVGIIVAIVLCLLKRRNCCKRVTYNQVTPVADGDAEAGVEVTNVGSTQNKDEFNNEGNNQDNNQNNEEDNML